MKKYLTFMLLFVFIVLGIGLLSLGGYAVGSTFSTAPTAQTPLRFPDTTNWKTHDLSLIKEGLIIQLPDSIAVYVYKKGVGISLSEDQTYHIKVNGGAAWEEPFDIKAERTWLENSPNRKDLVWLIDNEQEAYYTGLDLSMRKPYQETHSCYAVKTVADIPFYMSIDGIWSVEDKVYMLKQKDCLLFLAAFNSLIIND